MKKRILVRHHILNRCRGGSGATYNLLLIEEKKEKAFHLIFGHKTLEEAAYLLLRLARAKKNQKGRPKNRP